MSGSRFKDGYWLGVDTCGAAGSTALGELAAGALAIRAESAIAAGEFGSRLVSTIAELLRAAGVEVGGLAGVVVVAGPGSFTGIRIGLATIKALAEAADLPVMAVSRLALLAVKADAGTAVLDAHRGQFYCGMYADGRVDRTESTEMLLTAGEINAMGGLEGRVAICESAVEQALEELVGAPEVVRVTAPAASDALRFALSSAGGVAADVAGLDGYYLRGADAKLAARQG